MIRSLTVLLILLVLSCSCAKDQTGYAKNSESIKRIDFIQMMMELVEDPPEPGNTMVQKAFEAGILEDEYDLQADVDIVFASKVILGVLKSRSEIYFPDDITGEFEPVIFRAYIKGILDPNKEQIDMDEGKKIAERITDFKLRNIPVQILQEYKELIKVEEYMPPLGEFLPGDMIESSITFKNTTKSSKTYWVGYSLKDESGMWHDTPASKVVLTGNKSIKVYSEFMVSDSMMSGSYSAVTAIWTDIPGSSGAVRIANASQTAGIKVFSQIDEFNEIDTGMWSITDNNRLGRSRLRSANVSVDDGMLKIKLPKGKLDGGEIRSVELKEYGAYEIKMKLAYAPSSITGFFLYKAPDYDYEIDIEVYNDNKGEFFLTTYSEGKKQNEYHGSVPYDFTEDFHDFRIEYYENRVSFYIDDDHIKTWYDGYPKDSMYLMVNAWFPSWLEGEKPETDAFLYIDSLKE